MATPRALVFSGYGLNCEAETKLAFEQAGGLADIIHINDLIASPKQLAAYQILAFPGGFSYGDDTGAGNAFATKLRHHLGESLSAFVQHDTLAIGICNGFQIIANLGLVPATNETYTQRSVALVANDSSRYVARWVDLQVESRSPWLAGITDLSLPIAHGEGKLVADPAMIARLKANRQIALRYVSGPVCEYADLPANPNGSTDDIAGITDETGRILGLMPHPERAVFFTQQPHWPILSEQLKRGGKPIPAPGPGVAIFRNAVNYFR
ncbi:MAG TPA: phosphoribosylformylglycinamidine synthase subunit PurQ [Candidatus Saccharimonadales bacterium]|nr:phosphoribosylformylglycinamidine synthase subunit PurQ [Candidatus Saccharimonadales bacterium]